jgi:glycosyltransferase involved in cell wall biosynthesis
MTDICIAHGGDLGEPNGGTDRVSAIAAGLTEHGYDVTVVAPTPGGPLPDGFNDVPVETIDLPTHGVSSQPKRAYQVSRRTLALAAERDAVVQFEHSTLAGVGTLRGASGFVLDIHDLAFQSPLYGDLPLGLVAQRAIKALERRAVGRARSIVVVSEPMKRAVTETWSVPPDAIHVIPNGYFTDRINPYRTTERVNGRVVFLGTLHPKLDIDAMISIADLPEVTEFLVIGDGNKRIELERASDRHDSLTVTGRLPDTEAFGLVASASVAVNPQLPSGLQETSSPVKLCYYAALGVPAVVSEGPELAAQLHRNGAAVSIPSGGDVAGAVRRILRTDDERQQMAERAKRLATKLKWEQRIEQFATVYDRLCINPQPQNRS